MAAAGANMPAMAQRNADVSETIRWCGLSVGWAAIVGVRAIVARFAAGAVALIGHSAPERSPVGLALTAASVLVLPVLARAKLRLAGPLQSTALRGDGILSLAGAALAAVTLASLALDRVLGWWWTDAVAALAIAGFVLAAGWKTSRTARRRPDANRPTPTTPRNSTSPPSGAT